MRYKQRGASYLGIFAIIIVAAFAIKLAVAIWPAYWDDRVVNKEIADLLVALPKDTSQTKFKDELRKRLEMNNIRDLKVDDILKANNTSGLAVQKGYEVRKPFVSNIELVMTFKKDFDQRSIATQ